MSGEEGVVDAKNVGIVSATAGPHRPFSSVALAYARHVNKDAKKMFLCESISAYTWKKWPWNGLIYIYIYLKII